MFKSEPEAPKLFKGPPPAAEALCIRVLGRSDGLKDSFLVFNLELQSDESEHLSLV